MRQKFQPHFLHRWVLMAISAYPKLPWATGLQPTKGICICDSVPIAESIADIAELFWHLFAAVLSLECFICSSNESFQACDVARFKETCQPRTRCAKLSFQLLETHRYRKGCLSVTYCRNPDRYCQSIVDASDCETSCCSKDLCNSEPAVTSRKVNYFSLLLFTMVAMAEFH